MNLFNLMLREDINHLHVIVGRGLTNYKNKGADPELRNKIPDLLRTFTPPLWNGI